MSTCWLYRLLSSNMPLILAPWSQAGRRPQEKRQSTVISRIDRHMSVTHNEVAFSVYLSQVLGINSSNLETNIHIRTGRLDASS
ncbi:hypothetical protein EV127DRAFT_73817 [Xylaria flabelliformis]|nr:hypothetical protein EV127DRAFT_73817 [Xylaria flabelliformis]